MYSGSAAFSSRVLMGVWAAALASIWLVYPLFIGPLGLLRDFWSWGVFGVLAWVWLGAREPEQQLVPTLAGGLLLAALANAGQGLLQAYALLNHTSTADVYGFLYQRNQLATLCLMGIVAAGWLYSWRDSPPSARPALQALALLAAAVLGAVVSLSASRTGLLGLVLLWVAAEALALRDRAVAQAPGLHWPLRLAVLGYAIALLPTWGQALPTLGILARQQAQEGLDVCNSRLSLWANVLELIALKPWGGWGWGELDYAHFVTLFHGERFCALLDNAHNLPLQLAVEIGVPLAAGVCALALLALWRGQAWREYGADRLLAWGLLLALGVHSLLEYPLSYGPFQTTAVLAAWVLWRSPRQQRAGTSPARSAWSALHARALRAALALGLLVLGVAAEDYYRASQIYLQPTQRLAVYRDQTQLRVVHALFFQNHIDFARLGLTEVTADNAQAMHDLALRMLHFSPEAMVVQKLLASARWLGLQEEYDFYQARFAAAYPQAFLAWKASQPAD